jgi:hypothetical protein
LSTSPRRHRSVNLRYFVGQEIGVSMRAGLLISAIAVVVLGLFPGKFLEWGRPGGRRGRMTRPPLVLKNRSRHT